MGDPGKGEEQQAILRLIAAHPLRTAVEGHDHVAAEPVPENGVTGAGLGTLLGEKVGTYWLLTILVSNIGFFPSKPQTNKHFPH